MKLVQIVVLSLLVSCQLDAQQLNEDKSFSETTDLQITEATVVYDQQLKQLVFQIEVKGTAGSSTPDAIGKVDGAPVLGYVFPTNLKSGDVGFSKVTGIVALALTSHPDFDDTPLWDENGNRAYDDDGLTWHPHWVILVEDNRISGGLSVKKLDLNDSAVTLPPTHPGMPIYLDSPGFSVFNMGNRITAVVPSFRINEQIEFKFDAVTAYMQVNTSDPDLPMLGVYKVYSVLSGDLSLPYSVERK